ncbi:MAG: hypothetical protein ABI675_13080 [Chitinophagaceae bacterium]
MRQVFLLLFSVVVVQTYARESGVITGKWLKTLKEDLIIEVYKFENEYRGEITWVKDTTAKTSWVSNSGPVEI